MAKYKHYIAESKHDHETNAVTRRFHARFKHKEGGAPYLKFDPNVSEAVSISSRTVGTGSSAVTTHTVTVNLIEVQTNPGTLEADGVFTEHRDKLYNRTICKMIVNIKPAGSTAASTATPPNHVDDLVYDDMPIEDPIADYQ
ncbi:MAG: hypothetical protein MI974_28070 [Chitinophagales bacterium]|nr:hypothetical protein [Chitinophagales bacterium]